MASLLGESTATSSEDLIHLTGPLTQEAILRQLHENFMEGRCYVSLLCYTVILNLPPAHLDMDWTNSIVCQFF